MSGFPLDVTELWLSNCKHTDCHQLQLITTPLKHYILQFPVKTNSVCNNDVGIATPKNYTVPLKSLDILVLYKSDYYYYYYYYYITARTIANKLRL